MGRILLLVAGLATLVQSGCGTHTPSREEAIDEKRLATLADALQLTFPPGTQLLGVYEEEGMDDLLMLKVAMDSVHLDAFLASSPLKEAPFSEEKR